jgi:trehalose/maltose transport system permease protein
MATQSIPQPRTRKRSTGEILSKVGFWILIVLIIIYTVFPFYWAVVTSFTPSGLLFNTPVEYFPSQPTLVNYQVVFSSSNFGYALRNSIIVSALTVLLALLFGSFAAYALGRLRFRGKNVALYTILSMTMFPQIAVLGSLYEMVRNPCTLFFGAECPQASLYNTWWALILTYLTFSLPFTVWVLTTFFRSMPGELEEAAQVDGATPMQTFWMVLLPLALPGLVTTGLLAFIGAWNEFLFALTFTINEKAITAPVALTQFGGASQFELPWGTIMAASVIVTVPLVILVLVFQRLILAGLTAGAVKG